MIYSPKGQTAGFSQNNKTTHSKLQLGFLRICRFHIYHRNISGLNNKRAPFSLDIAVFFYTAHSLRMDTLLSNLQLVSSSPSPQSSSPSQRQDSNIHRPLAHSNCPSRQPPENVTYKSPSHHQEEPTRHLPLAHSN